MRINSAFEAGNLIAELAEDVWDKRDRLVGRGKAIYLPYRLSVSNHATDIDENFYVHFVVTLDRWYATVSSEQPFNIDHSKLIFNDNSEEWEYRMESWRHYAFSDLLSRAVRKYIESIEADMDCASMPYLWNTFPLEKFSEEVKALA